jgi:hypothetical protein
MTFWVTPNGWARRHPLQWAGVCAVGWFAAGWAVSSHLWFAFVAGAVGYVTTAVSVSNWPGRVFLKWRERDKP